jgi:aspartyl-tRNA(Asn)/glutamyl-tRNA(Gln) amidotransferase subunit C
VIISEFEKVCLDFPHCLCCRTFLKIFKLKPENIIRVFNIRLWYNPGMSLTQKEVIHIAKLARLELSAAEIERYQHQLSSILEYADRLKEVETGKIPPTSSVLPSRSRFREDIPVASLPVEKLLQNAPEAEKDQFKVPPALEEPQ